MPGASPVGRRHRTTENSASGSTKLRCDKIPGHDRTKRGPSHNNTEGTSIWSSKLVGGNCSHGPVARKLPRADAPKQALDTTLQKSLLHYKQRREYVAFDNYS